MRYIIFSLFFIFTACDSLVQTKEKAKSENVKKSYYPNKVLKSEIFYDDSSAIKLAKNYYKTGELATEIPYRNGMRNGISKKYYENGKIYRETPYINNVKHGVQKKYYESGQLMAEIPYQNNMPGKSIKEYTEKGNLITDYPEILVKHKNTIQLDGKYTVKIYLSDKSKKASYYKAELVDGEYFNKKHSPIYSQNGVVEINYNLQPGQYILEKINIIAYKTTRLRSPLILTKTINIAAEYD